MGCFVILGTDLWFFYVFLQASLKEGYLMNKHRLSNDGTEILKKKGRSSSTLKMTGHSIYQILAHL